MENNNLKSLPFMAFKEIPNAREDALSITGLVKHKGRIVGYKLSDNQMVDKSTAVSMARSGEIKDVGIAVRTGNEYLKSLPDGKENNNLGNLPAVAMGD